MSDAHGRKISTDELLEEKYREITRLYAIIEDRNTEIAQLKRTGDFALPGPQISVYPPDSEIILFTGHEIPDAAPWQFWRRIVPDGTWIDVPPAYRVEEI